jgi:hypothetical protein
MLSSLPGLGADSRDRLSVVPAGTLRMTWMGRWSAVEHSEIGYTISPMVRTLRVALGGYGYHVLKRGNGRGTVFHNVR